MDSIESIGQIFSQLLGYVNDANKRLYYLYLLSACALAVPVYWQHCRRKITKTSLLGFVTQLFNRRIWLADSAKQDYSLWVINRFIKVFVYAPVILMMVPVALATTQLLEQGFGVITFVAWPSWAIIAIFTLALFVIDDFTRFLLHWLLHKIPALWQFHKVHHSAKVLTPFTVYRSHPVESYLYACRMALAQGSVVGIGYYIFGPHLSMFDIAGANVFVFAFNIMGSNLRHSHIWLSWGDRFENWFISPAQHQVHHSDNPAHFDSNLGSALAVWDRLFGRLIKASNVGHIRFGLGKDNNEHQRLVDIYVQPFLLAFGFGKKNEHQK